MRIRNVKLYEEYKTHNATHARVHTNALYSTHNVYTVHIIIKLVFLIFYMPLDGRKYIMITKNRICL
jgi:hypothetical protein